MHKQWIKDGLSEYLSDAHAVWHMPGHKRRLGPKEMGHLYEMDIIRTHFSHGM